MEKRNEKILQDIEEDLKFFSELGVEFIFSTKDSFFISLQERILHCQKCPLGCLRKNAVPGEGNFHAELMFVGEAPGHDEDFQGRPFVGKAGQLLTKIIVAAKFERDEVYITNVVKCRPPENRAPQKEEIEKCAPYLLEQIDLIKPKVIVSLGKTATEFFAPGKLSMTAMRGKFCEFKNTKVMPTFHPSYLIRNEGDKEIKKMVWEDMKKVMAYLGKI